MRGVVTISRGVSLSLVFGSFGFNTFFFKPPKFIGIGISMIELGRKLFSHLRLPLFLGVPCLVRGGRCA